MKTFLHVGCGEQYKSGLKGFDSADWREIRFDIDPSVCPDIEGTLTDMEAVATGSVDAVFVPQHRTCISARGSHGSA